MKKLSNKLSRTTRRIAVMAVWFALVGIAGFLSMTGLASGGKPDYLIAAFSLLMFSMGVVILWPERQAGNPEQRTGKQAVMRWLSIGLLALAGAIMLYGFLQFLLHGKYLSAVILLIFLRAIGDALWHVWNQKKRL